MNPEQLKVIAEGMGYKCEYNSADAPMIFIHDIWMVYFPILNNDQMVEIMEKFDGDIEIHKTSPSLIEVALHVQFTKTYYGRGKTINEAVCNAAYEYFTSV